MPNAKFVAAVNGRDVVRAEPAGRAWLVIQDKIRDVLNRDWDPIGVVADGIDDEYDMYIGHIYSLLVSGSDSQVIAAHLFRIETERMGLTAPPMDGLLQVAATLKKLELPSATRE